MTKKIFLSEDDIPKAWYNITADMPNKPIPSLHTAIKQPLHLSDSERIFAKDSSFQSFAVWLDL